MAPEHQEDFSNAQWEEEVVAKVKIGIQGMFQDSLNTLDEVALEVAAHFEYAICTGALRLQTVDSSQGSEADIVILSCVRSNMDSRIASPDNTPP